jgi:hypothetical protein
MIFEVLKLSYHLENDILKMEKDQIYYRLTRLVLQTNLKLKKPGLHGHTRIAVPGRTRPDLLKPWSQLVSMNGIDLSWT